MFLLAATLVTIVLATGGAVAVASSSTPATVVATKVHACRKASNGEVFLWGSCPKGYVAYSWNVTGPAGPQGKTGPSGAAGPSGPAGPSFGNPFTLTLGGSLLAPSWTAYTCSVSATGQDGAITGVACLDPVSVVNRARS